MMRTICILLAPAVLLAQSASTTYQTDINGRRVPVTSQDQTNGARTERAQSVNGRTVPLEQVTEKIIRQDANGKLVERTIQKYDATGRPAAQERVTVEEAKLPGGGTRTVETRASNETGSFRPLDRVTTETRVAGDTTTTSRTLERPGVNQGFQTTERRSTVTKGPEGKQQTTQTVDQLDITGRFATVQRSESVQQTSGDKTTENTATYQLDAAGRMNLAKQTVATTTKRPGGDLVETTVYSAETPNFTQRPARGLILREQRITDRQIGADGSVREVVSVRTANPSDHTKLGEPRKVSETVCSGKCLPTPAPPPTTPAPQTKQ